MPFIRRWTRDLLKWIEIGFENKTLNSTLTAHGRPLKGMICTPRAEGGSLYEARRALKRPSAQSPTVKRRADRKGCSLFFFADRL